MQFQEMALKERLTVGSAYFIALFLDSKMQVPVIQTLIYSGNRLGADGGLEYHFDEIGADNQRCRFVVKEEYFDELVLDIPMLVAKLEEIQIGTA